jgi:hypothetical protein
VAVFDLDILKQFVPTFVAKGPLRKFICLVLRMVLKIPFARMKQPVLPTALFVPTQAQLNTETPAGAVDQNPNYPYSNSMSDSGAQNMIYIQSHHGHGSAQYEGARITATN